MRQGKAKSTGMLARNCRGKGERSLFDQTGSAVYKTRMHAWQQEQGSPVRVERECDHRSAHRPTNLAYQGERICKFVQHVWILVHDADLRPLKKKDLKEKTVAKVGGYDLDKSTTLA